MYYPILKFFSRARTRVEDEWRVPKIRQRVTEMVRRVEILYFNMDECRHLLADRVHVKYSMDTSLTIELTSWR
jgi:hypothetical protein